MDWLAVWGGKVIGFVFGEPLEELATVALRESVKDFFQGNLPDDIRAKRLQVLEVAFGQAVREFLQLFQQELEDAELPIPEVKRFNKSLKKFFRDPLVLAELGKPFRSQTTDADGLEKQWQTPKLQSLPKPFDWQRLAKRYNRKVDTILHESDELRSLLFPDITPACEDPEVVSDSGIVFSDKTFASSQVVVGIGAQGKSLEFANRSADKSLNTLTHKAILESYREAIQKTYGHLRLDSFDTSGYAYSLRLWNLFAPQNVREAVEVSPQAYELPKAELQRLRELGDITAQEFAPEELERIRQRYVEQSPRSVLEIIEDAQNFSRTVILGDPGSGKSSLVQYIALNWAEANPFEPFPVPIIVELRTYIRSSSQEQDFLDGVQQGSPASYGFDRPYLKNLLQQGQAFVLFDGLDEVFDPELRSQVETELIQFAQRYPQTRVLLTSRIIGYQGDRLRSSGFRHFVLQDFSDDQVEDFINRWHEFAYPPGQERERKRDRLKVALKNSTAIQQLAGNPLLLTMMAILNRNQELPRDRSELYAQSSRVLLQQWDVEKALDLQDAITIDYKDKQAMLRRVAFSMQTTDTGLSGNLIRGDELHTILAGYLQELPLLDADDAATRVIAQLRERNFILCYLGADYYAFVHRTFLEYFCAWEYVWQFEKERAIDLDYLKQQVFLPHYQDESWHEVLCLICSMIDSRFVGEIVEFLMELPVDRTKVDRFKALVKESYSHLLLAADCISEARNQSLIVPISNNLLHKIQQSLQTENFGKYSTLPAIIVHTIAKNWRDDPKTLPWLKACAQLNEDSEVRMAAISEVVKGWKDDPETLPWLKTCAQSDKHGNLRMLAVQELARGWKDDPEIIYILKTRALSDQDNDVRIASVQELARGWKDNLDTFSWLTFHAQFDENYVVRRTAIQELARGWKDNSNTLALLKTCAKSDENHNVRKSAIQELSRRWFNIPETFDFLYDLALNDPFEREYVWQHNPRLTALQAIVEIYSVEQKTLRLLQDRAKNDRDNSVRTFAKKRLEELQN